MKNLFPQQVFTFTLLKGNLVFIVILKKNVGKKVLLDISSLYMRHNDASFFITAVHNN